jgi:hypothetical protein
MFWFEEVNRAKKWTRVDEQTARVDTLRCAIQRGERQSFRSKAVDRSKRVKGNDAEEVAGEGRLRKVFDFRGEEVIENAVEGGLGESV